MDRMARAMWPAYQDGVVVGSSNCCRGTKELVLVVEVLVAVSFNAVRNVSSAELSRADELPICRRDTEDMNVR